MLRLGFVGTGTLVSAVIDGLQATHGDRCTILVSPRSQETSQALAARYANVTRAPSSAAVVEGSDVVFLGMRPNQLDEATAGLPFRPDQTVVSFLAGVPHARVSETVRPAGHVVRVNPLPPIRLRKGPVVIYPANPIVEDLFGGLGDLIVASKESDLAAIAHGSAMMSSHYALQNAIIDWLVSREMAPDTATHYVRSMFSGLAAVGLDAFAKGEAVDPAHHETKGGLNERGRRYLTEIGWFDEVGRALDVIEAHVLTARPKS
ncbi:pyrroline-5-carboxylate reductase [Angulomicrobium tetraedrale]|uniref:Pyrroline-5-carboxylate reductase n=1 Tax=Ancylobacter tetraedralis TaxID=217068 RepID=A0A839Z9K3_9HYPH|nr:NAD(P)-binding domain-containing protein [Ancylobacter tetraedralis]MBB3771197.1 pyrroline-5-carboxylate reductase [Ancylobacter tetraedralis]